MTTDKKQESIDVFLPVVPCDSPTRGSVSVEVDIMFFEKYFQTDNSFL
jgi:hypothetical protein